MKVSNRNVFISLVITISIILDQISKVLVRTHIISQTETNLGERISLIGNAFIMMNVENEGAFLGMGSNLAEPIRTILLLILPVLVLLFVIYYVIKDTNLNTWSLLAFSSIIGGGISNVFDRIVRGSVTDFLFIDLGSVFKTGIFNIADVFVTTGMIILFIASFKKEAKHKKAK